MVSPSWLSFDKLHCRSVHLTPRDRIWSSINVARTATITFNFNESLAEDITLLSNMCHSPSQCYCLRFQFHFTLSLMKIIWNMQEEVFCGAAKNGDLARVSASIAAGVSLNCTDEVRNSLCRNSHDHDYYRITNSYLYLSLSLLFHTDNLSLLLTLSHYHLLSVSPLTSFQSLTLAPSETRHSFFLSLSQCSLSPWLSISLCLAVKLFVCHYFHLDLISLLIPLSLSPITVHSFIPFNSSLYLNPSLTLIVVALFYICLSLSASLPCAQCI